MVAQRRGRAAVTSEESKEEHGQRSSAPPQCLQVVRLQLHTLVLQTATLRLRSVMGIIVSLRASVSAQSAHENEARHREAPCMRLWDKDVWLCCVLFQFRAGQRASAMKLECQRRDLAGGMLTSG